MGLNVISNFAASVAHRNLVMSDAQATLSLAKISSGKRVLSAKDDAASLAIGSRLRAEVEALKQANQNTSQAASMLQIADGGFATISDMLVRLKTLSVQAASGQLSSNERSVLDGEFQALLSEIDRISNDTEFNGTALIAGGAAVFTNSQFGTTSELSGGAAPGITVTFDTANLNTAKVTSGDAFRLSFNGASGTAAQNLTIINVTTGDRQTVDIRASLNTLVSAQSPAGTANTGNLVAGQDLVVNFDNIGVKVSLDEFFDRTSTALDTEAVITIADDGTFASSGSTATLNFNGVNNAAIDALCQRRSKKGPLGGAIVVHFS